MKWIRKGLVQVAVGERATYRITKAFGDRPSYMVDRLEDDSWVEFGGSPYPKQSQARGAVENYERG